MEMEIESVTDLITAIYSKDLRLTKIRLPQYVDKNRFRHRLHHCYL